MRISKKGFTLIEVMVAATILAIGCLGVLGLMMTAIKYNNNVHMRTTATYIAEQEVALFESIGNTTKCAGSTWVNITTATVFSTGDLKFAPKGMDPDFEIYCRTYKTEASTDPIAIRVTWGTSGGKCSAISGFTVNKLDSYSTSKAIDCDFVTLPYVPVPKTTTPTTPATPPVSVL